MTLATALTADMATVSGWITGAWQWWIAELAELVPARFRDRPTARMTMASLSSDGRLIAAEADNAASTPPLELPASKPVVVRLHSDQCLFRVVEVPRLKGTDLDRFLELEAPRLFPMVADDTLVAGQPLRAQQAEARLRVFVASLPRSTALAIADAAATQRLALAHVVIEQTTEDESVRADFNAAMQRQGLLPKPGFARAGWWLVVALMVMLNLAIMAWRDASDVDRLRQLVDAQRPGVVLAQRLVKLTASNDRLVRGIVDRRNRQEPLAVLAAATRAIPDDAWVQRFTWDGATVRLAGYKRRTANIQTTLRNSSLFTGVRNNSADDIAEIPAGQPFDISATFRSPGP